MVSFRNPCCLSTKFGILIIHVFLNRFKHNGQNFHVQLLKQGYQNQNVLASVNPNVSLPEELVQIQAYLRWERKGRQTYTPDQEKASVIYFVNKTIQ